MSARRETVRAGSASASAAAESAPVADGPTESFDETLVKLDRIVARLDAGDAPLEESLAAFEQGVALARRCAQTLDAAERRIELLTGDEDGGALRALDAAGVADED